MARWQALEGNVLEVESLGRGFTIDLPSLTLNQSLVALGETVSYVAEGFSANNADDYVVYVGNTGTVTILITFMSFEASAATTLWLDYVSGTPVYTAPVNVPSVNKKVGDPTDPFLTYVQDSEITGLNQESPIMFERCAVANARYLLDTISTIELEPGRACAIRSSNPAAVVDMNMDVVVLFQSAES